MKWLVTYRCFDVNSSEKMTTSVDEQMELVNCSRIVVSQAGCGAKRTSKLVRWERKRLITNNV